MAKLSKSAMRLQGRQTWLAVLLRQQRFEEAHAWARKHKLALPASQENAAAQAAYGAGSVATVAEVSLQQSAAMSVTASPLGGEGIQQVGLAKNLDRSAPTVEISQSRKSDGQLPSGDGALASPSGELEGMGNSRQADSADKGGLFSNRLESGWVVSGEGVVWGRCPNRWFVQVDVGGRQAKAAVGEAVLQRGDRVRVRLEWVSADGRDAEYAIVGRLAGDGAEAVVDSPKAVESPVMTTEGLLQDVPDDGVPVIPEEPIAPGLIAEMQKALGLDEGVQADVVAQEEPSEAEAASENGYDYMERMRRQAYRELLGS